MAVQETGYFHFDKQTKQLRFFKNQNYSISIQFNFITDEQSIDDKKYNRKHLKT